ncbi:MAG: sterol desaturase family protein [Flavobacteriales bacterium]|nr:sterol desaturase family protein [Flavobacteriales bacterium]MCB9448221.1 sterol desaturase family protein [Flavobacteriales bacterium]
MWDFIWNTRGYFFWLLVVSVFVFFLERLFPWRKEQKVMRKGIWQDFFFLVFNGHYLAIVISLATAWLLSKIAHFFQISWNPESVNLLSGAPIWVQAIVFLVFKDLVEWWIHRALHTFPWLWRFHKLHHSIHDMDWIGNFRFHWMEVVVYKTLSYLPLTILGVDGNVILIIAVIGTLIGHLNHANLRWDYGPLRHILNSPRFHVWHHDKVNHQPHGQNFAIFFSFWDWLFGTAYWPEQPEQPEALGFQGDEKYPQPLWKRMLP